MKCIIFALFLVASLAQYCPENYELVTISMTGDTLGTFEPTDVVTLSLQGYSSNAWVNIINGELEVYCNLPSTTEGPENDNLCTSDPTFTIQSIIDNTASIDYCLLRTAGSTTLYRLNTVSPLTIKGFCVNVIAHKQDFKYWGLQCPDSRTNIETYFTVNPLSYQGSELLGRRYTVADQEVAAVYVDGYKSFDIRPELYIYNVQSSDTTNRIDYVIYELTFNDPSSIGLTFDYNTFTFSTLVAPSAEAVRTFSVSNKVSETETSTLNVEFKTFTCENAYEVPTVFTRVFNQRASNECFYFKQVLEEGSTETAVVHGDCPSISDDIPSDWNGRITYPDSNARNYVYEYAECLPMSKYQLYLTNFALDAPYDYTEKAWVGGSFLTITTLSTRRAGETDFDGYIVGDFAYTAYCGLDSIETDIKLEQTNVVDIYLGPTNCKEDEQVVVLQKLSTADGNTEGFVISMKNEEGNYVVSNTFFGAASITNYRFDPYYKVFICLSKNDYKITLYKKAVVTDSYAQCEACSGWSTINSVEVVTYTKLDGVVASAVHPSFMKVDVLKSNSYHGEEVVDSLYSIEGENYAVFNGRTHIITDYAPSIPATDIYSRYDCHYDFYITLKVADFTIFDEDVEYAEHTILNKDSNSRVNIDVKCNDMSSETECSAIDSYTVTCYYPDENTLLDCSNYGLGAKSFENGVLSFNGLYTTPSGNEEYVNLKIESVIKTGQTASFNPTSHVVELKITPTEPLACYNYNTQQGGTVHLPANSLISSCSINGIVVPEGTYTSVANAQGGIDVTFTGSNTSPFVCTAGGENYNIYVKPVCVDNTLPLQMSIDYTVNEFVETCSGNLAEETYCVYDPMTFKAELVHHLTECHINVFTSDSVLPPRGHGYVLVSFSIETEDGSDDYNAAPSAAWFKQELEYAISEVSHVPMRDTFIIGLKYDSATKSNKLDIVIDTAFEYTRDMALQFAESKGEWFIIDEINAKLDLSTVYWATHNLVVDSYDMSLRENYCRAETDDWVNYYYIDPETHEESEKQETNAVFDATIIWYYSYFNPIEFEAEYTGAITRYCKPKYYDAIMNDYDSNSYAQMIDYPWFDLHYVIVIEHMDPRGANIDVRYNLARALAMFVHNKFDAFSETYDINVYMIKGENLVDETATEPGNENWLVYHDTKFYVELRNRNEVQRTNVVEHIRKDLIEPSTLDDTNYFIDEVQSEILGFLRSKLGESFRTDNKLVRIEF